MLYTYLYPSLGRSLGAQPARPEFTCAAVASVVMVLVVEDKQFSSNMWSHLWTLRAPLDASKPYVRPSLHVSQ